MTQLTRSLTVAVPLPRVADYLSDLTTSPQWDPHTRACRRLDDGPLGVGARYEHTREFAGREVTLEVEVVEYEQGARIVWAGGNRFADGREHFAFDRDADGATVVEHGVEVTLHGVFKAVGEAMVPGVMNRIADDGTSTLRTHLEQLG